MNKQHPEIRSVWITRNEKTLRELRRKGYECYKDSFAGSLCSLKAGCVFMSSGLMGLGLHRFALGGAKKVLLWHASPTKKIGYDDLINFVPGLEKRNRFLRFLIESRFSPYNERYDVAIASSEEGKKKIHSGIRINKDRIHITGFPRNDALFDTKWLDSGKNLYLKSIRQRVKFKHVFLYLPTTRERRKYERVDLFGKYGFDSKKIQKTLEKLDAILIIKAHPGDRVDLPGNSSDQRVYTPASADLPDAYQLLKETDVLITDYSSVYLDFLLLDRPVIFAPFDINEYIKKDRELYYDYDDVTPGPKAKDWCEVFKLAEKSLKKDTWKGRRLEVCKRFNKFRDNKSSERVFKLVMSMSGLKKS